MCSLRNLVEQHPHIAPIIIRDRDIRSSVVVEIGNRRRNGASPTRYGTAFEKVPSPLPRTRRRSQH